MPDLVQQGPVELRRPACGEYLFGWWLPNPVTIGQESLVLSLVFDRHRSTRSPPSVKFLRLRELISPDELVRLAGTVPGRYRALVLVGGVLGLRWGEAIGLRACDIDFMRRTVTVAQVVEEIAGHLRVVPGETKTAGSLRTLAAPAFLIDEIARHLREHRPDALGDRLALVFVGPRGGILRRRFAERTFRPAVERAGLDPSLTFHGLRHVAMSTLVDENVHPRVMQGRAGHASSKLTMELYAHVTDEADRDAADALENRFRPALRAPYGHAAGTEGR